MEPMSNAQILASVGIYPRRDIGRASSTRIALETAGAAALGAVVAVSLGLLAIHFGGKLDLKMLGATIGLAGGVGVRSMGSTELPRIR